jgi:hypothetical protein
LLRYSYWCVVKLDLFLDQEQTINKMSTTQETTRLKELVSKLKDHLKKNPVAITLMNHERIIQKEIVLVFINDTNKKKRESSYSVNLMQKSLKGLSRAHVYLCYNSSHEQQEDDVEENGNYEEHYQEDGEKLYQLLERNSREKEDRTVILISENHGMIVTKMALDQLRDHGYHIDGLSILSFGSWNAALDRSETQLLYELYHIFYESDIIDAKVKDDFLKHNYEAVEQWGLSMEEFDDLLVLDCSLKALKTGVMPLQDNERQDVFNHFQSMIQSCSLLTEWLESAIKVMEQQGIIFLPDTDNQESDQEFHNLWSHYVHQIVSGP